MSHHYTYLLTCYMFGVWVLDVHQTVGLNNFNCLNYWTVRRLNILHIMVWCSMFICLFVSLFVVYLTFFPSFARLRFCASCQMNVFNTIGCNWTSMFCRQFSSYQESKSRRQQKKTFVFSLGFSSLDTQVKLIKIQMILSIDYKL